MTAANGDTHHPPPTLPSATMHAMVTVGHGGIEMLEWHTDWPRPTPGPGEVLVRVRACGLNNTDINTREGWYSKAVTTGTGSPSDDVAGDRPADDAGAWGGSQIQFPRIQGADVCGVIEGVGNGVDPARIGERIISDNWIRDPADPTNISAAGYLGSERDGGFADYTVLPSTNALAVSCELSDAELATFSCSYATAEGMLTRAGVTSADTILVSGASGGVGSALVQLARLRGARVIAMASASKHDAVAQLSPDKIVDRSPADLSSALGDERVTVVADIVGGSYWPNLIEVLARGGRYVCSGAIAGPIVDLDLRTLYLNDLTFEGSTVTSREVMEAIVGYIERGEISPVLAATYPLSELATAQRAFLDKHHVGNIVVTTADGYR